MGQQPGEIRQEIEETREQLGDTVSAIGYKTDIKSRAKDSIDEKRDRLKERITGTKSRMNDATPDASDLKSGAHKAVGVAQENPLGLAAGAIAAGFLIGMAMPKTRIERERIGPVADELKDMAKERGHEVLERGSQVVQDTVEGAKQAARESGEQQMDEMNGAEDGATRSDESSAGPAADMRQAGGPNL